MADGGLGGRRRLGDRQSFENTAIVPTTFPSYWTKPDVKGYLYAMQGRICAYCGLAASGLEVEHFRPKGAIGADPAHGGYWWLAYESANYFLSCTACNGARKRTDFPLLPGQIRTAYVSRAKIAEEGRIFLDPSEDPVEEWLTIEPDDLTAEIVPSPSLGANERLRVQQAIDHLGLNLDAEVRTQRSKAYEAATRAAVEQRWAELRRGAMRHSPHSLVARLVLQRTAPDRLPDAEEEVRSLIEMLWGNLLVLLQTMRGLRSRGRAASPVDERQTNTLIWALIIIRSDPPADDSAAVDDFLAELLRRAETADREEIVSLFRNLPH